ncbi:MAG: hypothetical protein F4151_01535 [Gammaproteobacteria bacterium]|nr:hypothetical protein [Gammaproteobacteria bacterium]
MSRTEIQRTIAAPANKVFAAVADVRHFSRAVEHIERVEFLSDTRTGLGTRFRETRVMRGREATVELEITEFAPPERVRFLSEAGGVKWDTVFTVVAGRDRNTRLMLVMEATPLTFPARLMVPLMKGMVRKAIAADMDAVKAYCEGSSGGS